MRMAALAALFALAGAAAAQAAPPANDPDWPCQQPFMPTLTAASFWSGPTAAGDWHANDKVADLVREIAPRDVAAGDGVTAIGAFAKPLPAASRQQLLPLVFAGLVEATNEERNLLLTKLKEFGARQRNLSTLIGKLTAEHDAIPPDATGDDGKRRADLAERMDYTIRAFDGMQRTIRYACEAPVALEGRLGAYARALEAALN